MSRDEFKVSGQETDGPGVGRSSPLGGEADRVDALRGGVAGGVHEPGPRSRFSPGLATPLDLAVGDGRSTALRPPSVGTIVLGLVWCWRDAPDLAEGWNRRSKYGRR
jgi:hypothetical protein